MRPAFVYEPADLAPPSEFAPAWVKQIRGRLQKPGARTLFDSLMESVGNQLCRAIPASHGWLRHCFLLRLLAEKPDLEPPEFPSEQVYRQALAELRSAGLVRVKGRGQRVEFTVLAPLRAPAQRELDFPPAEPAPDEPAEGVSEFVLRVYPEPEESSHVERRDPALEMVHADRRVSVQPPCVGQLGAAALPTSAASVAASIGAGRRRGSLPGAEAGNRLPDHRSTRRAAAPAESSASRSEVLQNVEGSLVAPPQVRPHEAPAHAAPPAEVSPAPRSDRPQTFTSKSKSLLTPKTYTSARPEPDPAAKPAQARLPLRGSADAPPPSITPADPAAVAAKVLSLVAELRAVDEMLDVEPVLRVVCTADCWGRIHFDEIASTVAAAKARRTPAGGRIKTVGSWLMDQWQRFVSEADLAWSKALAPPEVRAAAIAAANAADVPWIPRLAPKNRRTAAAVVRQVAEPPPAEPPATVGERSGMRPGFLAEFRSLCRSATKGINP